MNDTPLTVTGPDDAARLEQLLNAFEGLTPGGSLEVVFERDPAPLLPAMQEKHWGGFDWHPLTRGPDLWRVALRRLPRPLPARALGEFMGYDHHRCDALYAETENAALAGDLETTRRLFDAFELGMRHHFNMEEKRFFPAFEQATGMTQGPTMVMRMEHRQMLGVIGQMRQAVDQGDLSGVTRAASTLMVLMRQHNIKEEQMLYPMGDMHLGGLVDGLLQGMQTLEESP